jgi:phosphoserine phosphatase
MGSTDGSLTGRVSRYFGEHDTVRFVKEWCAAHGYHIEQAAAVGDSRSTCRSSNAWDARSR